MNKEETRSIIKEIFDYIENGSTEDLEGHPALYFFHTKEELEQKIEEFLSSKEKFDKYDIYYFSNKMIKFLLETFDSHTRVAFFKGDEIDIPIRFKIINNKIYIINISPDFQEHNFSELIAINGINIEQIIKEIEETTCYSTKEFLNTKIEYNINYIGLLRSLPSISSNAEVFQYRVKKDKQISELTLNMNEEYKPCVEETKENYSYEIKDDVLIIVYNLCKDREKIEELVQKVKTISKEKNINKYIIDIRGNIGGDSTIIHPLINFLKDKETVTLIDKEVFSSGRFACVSLKDIGSYFIGTGIGTTLSAFGYVSDSKQIENPRLRIFSSIRYFIFDNNLNCTTLTKSEFQEHFKKKEEFYKLDKGIFMPDLYVEKTLEDYINNNDPQLEAGMNYLKNIFYKNSEHFIIKYVKADENILDGLIEYLEENIMEIYEFFSVEPTEKIKINLIPTKEKLDELFGETNDWVTGFINSNTRVIFTLSYNDYKNTSHNKESFEQYKKTVMHECVHIINVISSNNNLPITPIWEGIACYLSKQYDGIDISMDYITLEDLLSGKSDYKDYYLIIKDLINMVDKDTLLDILNSKTDAVPYLESIIKK